MPNTEKVYSRVTEAENMIKGLCKKQPDVLWCVRPEMVAVYGIENKERPEKNKTLAKIRPVKGSGKAILQDNNIPIRYVVELYWSDWNEWKETKKQWILLHELLHIHHDIGKTIKHDIEDFKIILDRIGVCGYDSETLPDLINGEVKFNLDLRPSLEDSEDNETDDIEDDEDNHSIKKNKKTEEKEEKKDVSKEGNKKEDDIVSL